MSSIQGAAVSLWLDMMSDTVTIEPWSSQSVTGVPTYSGVPVSYTCYIEMKNHLVVNSQGREVMARGRVFLATTTIIGIKDKLTLPTGYLPLTPPIIAVNVVNDELGNHHVTLEIG